MRDRLLHITLLTFQSSVPMQMGELGELGNSVDPRDIGRC